MPWSSDLTWYELELKCCQKLPTNRKTGIPSRYGAAARRNFWPSMIKPKDAGNFDRVTLPTNWSSLWKEKGLYLRHFDKILT